MTWAKRLTGKSRKLRRRQTDPERRLWRGLRNSALGFKFRRQHPLLEQYIADFACVEAKLILELDGAGHLERAHEDAVRDERLARAGWRVLRIGNHEVVKNTGGVLQRIFALLHPSASR